ncbi:MAG: RloB family protein [Bacteroidales bacterium]|nr:RloB family protein [Bacteroidales bacterium]
MVCEGKNTEPSYFSNFRLSSVKVIAIGEGKNTVSLVVRACELAGENTYEQTWCVFDKDDFSNENFNKAIEIANSNGISVAYSNQAFEYWILLHLNDHQGGKMHRSLYEKKINSKLKSFGLCYNKDRHKQITEQLFEFLIGYNHNNQRRVDLAITRAKRNYNQFDHTNPAQEESSTTVFKLVEELLKHE